MRRKGGGRRHLSSRDTTLIEDLRNVIEPATLGDPMRPLLWVSKSYEERRQQRHTLRRVELDLKERTLQLG